MKKIVVFTILVLSLGLFGCSDTRILPSDTTGTLFYFQPPGSPKIFSIEFDNDSTGKLREWEPGTFSSTDSLVDLLAADPPIDKDDPSNFVEVPAGLEAFTISGLSGTRHLMGVTLSSDAGITTWKVWLNTFKTYGLSNFSSTLVYRLS